MSLHKESSINFESMPKHSTWTSEQDKLLMELVKTSGKDNWKSISETITSTYPSLRRSAKDCKRRWNCLINGLNSKKLWTEQEELEMILAHHKYKNKWAQIAESVKGWDNNTIKNKFYSAFRRVKSRIMKGEYLYNSKVELLEVHYFISLIEESLNTAADNSKKERKRGNDFIHSLVTGLNKLIISKYKTKLQEISKENESMEELFEKLSNKDDLQMEEVLSQPANSTIEEEHSESKSPSCFHNLSKIPEISQKIFDPEYSIFMESEIISPFFVPLSAGPAAAAEGASRALCFKAGIDGFSDASSLVQWTKTPIMMNEQNKEKLLISSVDI